MGDSRPVLAHQARKQHLAQQAAKTTPIQRTVQKIMVPPTPQPRAPIATRPTPKRTIAKLPDARNTGTPSTVSDVSTITGQPIDDLPTRGSVAKETAEFKHVKEDAAAFEIEKAAIKERIGGGGSKGVAEMYRFISSAFIKPKTFLGVTSEAMFGEKEGKLDRILNVYTEGMTGLSKIAEEKGAAGMFKESYKKGGFGRTATLTFGTAAGAGAGIGAVKSALPLTGTAAEVGLISYGGVKTYQGLKAAEKEGGRVGLGAAALGAGMYLPFAISGYKTGHTYGFGKGEAYIYKTHTFKSGTPEAIRFTASSKIISKLGDVKSHIRKPLDFAKDISRMDKASAAKITQFLKKKPSTVVSGSAASKTQVEGARVPRDADFIVTGSVPKAKAFFGKSLKTPKGEHRIDIHGTEFYKPGKYIRFGRTSKTPIKIGGVKYFKAGEQLTRKGISSVTKETRYRHGQFPGFPKKGTMQAPKDVADFVSHSRSLITSAKKSINPFTRLKGASAKKHLDVFLDPSKSPKFGQGKPSLFQKAIVKTTKPITPKVTPRTYGFDYAYPKHAYPSYAVPVSISGAIGYSYTSKTTPKKTTGYTPTIKTGTKPSYTPPNVPKKTPVHILPSYPSTPKKQTPSYTPPYKPSSTTPSYMTPGAPKKASPYKPSTYKTKKMHKKQTHKKTISYPTISITKKKKKIYEYKKKKKYKFRKFDIGGII